MHSREQALALHRQLHTLPEPYREVFICGYGEILLWDAEENIAPILYGHVGEDGNTCVFENLTAARYYRVTCEGGVNLSLTISEGRIVSFWHSLVNALLGR